MKKVRNPIPGGWCSDPSILRVGEDYYIAASTFEWMPGVSIYHSRELIHWERLPGALQDDVAVSMEGMDPSCGIWAPNLTYCDGLFYLAYTIVYTSAHRYKDTRNFLITAEDVRGPWSEPVFLHSIGFDPSIFHEDDGRKYVVSQTMEHRTKLKRFRGVTVQEYDPAAQRVIGKAHLVFEGTDRGVTEGPNIMKKDGWYYITAAEGGTEFGHCVTMARSRSLFGPYKVDPQNPMLSSTGTDCELQRAGHGQYVSDLRGNWYMAHLCSRPLEGKWSILGREAAIQNIDWPEGSWPRIRGASSTATPKLWFEAPDVPEHPFPEVPERTNFSQGIPVQWMSLRRSWPNCGIDLSAREGWVRVYGGNSLCSHYRQHLLARAVSSLKCECEMLWSLRRKHLIRWRDWCSSITATTGIICARQRTRRDSLCWRSSPATMARRTVTAYIRCRKNVRPSTCQPGWTAAIFTSPIRSPVGKSSLSVRCWICGNCRMNM